MPAGPDRSYAELAAENAALRTVVDALRIEVDALRAEVAGLRRQLGSNSQNSSRPPSTDSPFDKPAPKSLRGKSGRKPAGQAGHPGQTLRQVADPDEVVVHEPSACRRCGRGLADRPGSPIYTMIFATDNYTGDKIMRHIYGKAAEKRPKMQGEAAALMQEKRENKSGVFGLFPAIAKVIGPDKLYEHEPPVLPYGMTKDDETD